MSLLNCCANGNYDLAKILIDKNIQNLDNNIVLTSKYISSCFLISCRYNHYNIIKLLLSNNLCDRHIVDSSGFSAIMWSCVTNNKKMFKFLLKQGVTMNNNNNNNNNNNIDHIYTIIFNNDHLLKLGLKFGMITESLIQSKLDKLIYSFTIKRLSLLIEYNIILNNDYFISLLFKNRLTHIIEYIFNLDMKNNVKYIIFKFICKLGLDMLYLYGNDYDEKTSNRNFYQNDGRTSEDVRHHNHHYVNFKFDSENGSTGFLIACKYGSLNIVKKLINFVNPHQVDNDGNNAILINCIHHFSIENR